MKSNIFKVMILLASVSLARIAPAEEIRIALVAKALNNEFFSATYLGAQQAADELDNVRLIYIGPEATSTDDQITIIKQLINAEVDVIAISANHTEALVPALNLARAQGIKVMTWDSDVLESARQFYLQPSNPTQIAKINLKLASAAVKHKGDKYGQIALLSATEHSTNQNAWLTEINQQLDSFEHLSVVETVYGDDLFQQSYEQSLRLLNQYPGLDVIVAPTTVGLRAAGQAIIDSDKIENVYATGLGLPSEMRDYVHEKAVLSFAIWNPIDLGYAATLMAYNLAIGSYQNDSISLGRMGMAEVDDQGVVVMSAPFIFDAYNVDEFAHIF